MENIENMELFLWLLPKVISIILGTFIGLYFAFRNMSKKIDEIFQDLENKTPVSLDSVSVDSVSVNREF